jgi:hypothetical protein
MVVGIGMIKKYRNGLIIFRNILYYTLIRAHLLSNCFNYLKLSGVLVVISGIPNSLPISSKLHKMQGSVLTEYVTWAMPAARAFRSKSSPGLRAYPCGCGLSAAIPIAGTLMLGGY